MDADFPPPQGFDPLPDQKGPLCTVLNYQFSTFFEAAVCAEKERLFAHNVFKKFLKNAFFFRFSIKNILKRL